MRKFLITVMIGVLSVSIFTSCSTKEKKESTTEKTTEKKTEKTTSTEETTEDSDEEILKNLENQLSEAYMGLTEDGIGVYYAGNDDGSIGILLFADPDSKETASFVGTVEQVGRHALRITDESSQSTMTFGITRLEDNTLLLDLGEDIGKAQIEACKISEVLDAMKVISDNANPLL